MPTRHPAAGALQHEARAWLTEEAAALLELAGYDPDPVLRRVWQSLGPG